MEDVTDELVGRVYPNGTSTGQLGLVYRGKVDVMFNNYVITKERLQHFHFSHPVKYNQQGFLFKQQYKLSISALLNSLVELCA